jgi:hypothetical protein
MKLTTRWIATAALAAGFFATSVAVRAQAPDVPPPPPEGTVFFERIGGGPDVFYGPVDFMGFEGQVSRKTVTGAPFTGTFTSHSTQTLADGNHIQHSSTGSVARDSQGRTRRDVTLPAIGAFASSGQSAPHVVMLNDPVAGTHFILHPDQKTADTGGHMKGTFINRELHGLDASRVKRHADEIVTTSLGTQTISGVSAEGTRYTRTIPAGEIGNEKPIQIVTERWYSPELQMNVMTKRTDPINGDSVFQFTEIQRSEPAATLFQVPADYTINTPRAGRRRGPAPEAAQPQ